MNKNVGPIFIISSERSGTNLLRVRLTENQALYYGPSPAHLLKNLYFLQPYFGDLSDDANFLVLVERAIRLCKVHFAPWDVSWKAKEIINDYGSRERDVIFLMDYMMTRFSKEKGYVSYVSKENYNYEFALDIFHRIPNSRFIYLHRDPRDFAVSQLKRHRYYVGVVRYARLWQYEQTRSIRVHEILARSHRCISVSYESFISDEVNQMNRILDFINVKKSTTRNVPASSIDVLPHEWKNIFNPTMSNNHCKYKNVLFRYQIEIIERICERQMQYLGYERMYSGKKFNLKFFVKLDNFRQFLSRFALFFLDKFLQIFTLGSSPDDAFAQRSRLLRDLYVNYRNDH